MKKIILFLCFVFVACTSDEALKLVDAEESIIIDKNSQIQLNPTNLDKNQILDLSCGEPYTTTLFAGQHINVGSISIVNDELNLYVSYNLSGNWFLKETHLFVGEANDIPYNNGGNPKIGHFPFHGDHGLVKNYIFTIPLNKIEDCYTVVAHAAVVKKEGDQIIGSESAFGYGDDEFPGHRWGWYFDHCKQECSDGCLDVFGKVQDPLNAYCFNFKDEEEKVQWAWSNEFVYTDLMRIQQEGTYIKYPLYANISDACATHDKDIIGYIQMTVHGGDGRLFTDIKYVITDSNYLINQITLYVGSEQYPIDEDGNINDKVSKDDFKLIELDTPVSEHVIRFIPWPTDEKEKAFVIPHANVCFSEATHT